LYPFARYTFRVAEVLLRVVPVACLFVFVRVEVALRIVAANFFECHMRDTEVFRVHIVVAFPLLVADITQHVDRPNFVLPAQSFNVQQMLRALVWNLSAETLWALWRLTGACVRHFQVHPFYGRGEERRGRCSPFMSCLVEWPRHQGTAIIFSCQ